ncbi:SLATT domain-containing protein [Streptomyces atroolivaceus]|uniref:SLATT domain-containing protein n=1 Tax=Streptomyces atroolivaceus TaxID=66869 RepID=A0ABV9V3Y6_STRAZ|nr:SLATT domain-containing protein [Streptomyces atroolivaceus]
MPQANEDPVLEQALRDLAWYERIMRRSRRWAAVTELTALATGAGAVVAAGIQAPAAVTASIAGTTLFVGGFRQLFHHAERHVQAAEAWSRLRLAIQRYTLVAEADRSDDNRQRLLEEVEAVADTELQSWATSRRLAQPPPGGQALP